MKRTGALPAEQPLFSGRRLRPLRRSGATRRPSNRTRRASPRRSKPISAGSGPATMWRCSPISSAAPRISRPCSGCAEGSATGPRRRPASALVRAFCIRPVRPTRAARTAACFCRSPARTPPILPVPGQKYSFGVVKAAQARGDFDVLAERGRRALRVHLSGGLDAGLEALARAVDEALK